MKEIYNPLTLTFKEEDLEAEFWVYYWNRFINSIRSSLLLGIFLYALFSFLDAYLYPFFKFKLIGIRFFVAIPLLSIVYYLLGLKKLLRYSQLFILFGAIVANFGIIEMIRIIQSYHYDKNIYFSGLLLSGFFAYAFFRLRFIYAVLVGFFTIAGYEMMVIWISDIYIKDFVANNFFLVPFYITGMLFSYALELDSRNYFLLLKKLEEEKSVLKNVNLELDRLAHLDGLTEIANKRYLMEKLAMYWYAHKKAGQMFSVIMIDVDFFKNYNDTYGHLEGDNVLKAIAKELTALTRKNKDIVGRFGGEEFVVILPQTDEKRAYEIAERIRERIKNLNIPHKSSDIDNVVTVSIGISSLIPDDDDYEKILELADKALYMAKKSGRNKVCCINCCS